MAGVLRPAHLLDVIRHFTTYQVVSGRTVKIVCRYPQYRAVHAAVARRKLARRGAATASMTDAAA